MKEFGMSHSEVSQLNPVVKMGLMKSPQTIQLDSVEAYQQWMKSKHR